MYAGRASASCAGRARRRAQSASRGAPRAVVQAHVFELRIVRKGVVVDGTILQRSDERLLLRLGRAREALDVRRAVQVERDIETLGHKLEPRCHNGKLLSLRSAAAVAIAFGRWLREVRVEHARRRVGEARVRWHDWMTCTFLITVMRCARLEAGVARRRSQRAVAAVVAVGARPRTSSACRGTTFGCSAPSHPSRCTLVALVGGDGRKPLTAGPRTRSRSARSNEPAAGAVQMSLYDSRRRW